MHIYKITNIINGKVYIGLTTVGLEKRWKRHLKSSGSKRACTPMFRALRKYGKKAFTMEAIDTASSIEELNKKEISWISFYDSTNPNVGYNITKGGGGCLGVPLSKEAKMRIAICSASRVHSEESKEKQSLAKLGTRRTKKGLEAYREVQAKLTKEQVIEIKNELDNCYYCGMVTDLAKKYKVDITIVSKIRKGKIWREITDPMYKYLPQQASEVPHEYEADSLIAIATALPTPKLLIPYVAQGKLTREQVIEIKKELNTPRFGVQTALARRYGVNYDTIRSIKKGVTWKDVIVPDSLPETPIEVVP